MATIYRYPASLEEPVQKGMNSAKLQVEKKCRDETACTEEFDGLFYPTQPPGQYI